MWSGAHPGYKPDPQKPVEFAILDIRLTRGDETSSDSGFANQVMRFAPEDSPALLQYHVKKLQLLAQTEQGAIRANACEFLWIYSKDKTWVQMNQLAANAMAQANCTCAENPNGVMERQ